MSPKAGPHLNRTNESRHGWSTTFFPSILWPQVIAMRNVLVHDYFGVDLEEIWRVVERDLPELKNKLKKLVGELEKNK
jgi:uncharacterized protein with HEPN domain